MEFTEKYTKKYVKGSTVVEMSYLIPFCLILFFLLITIIFYFHDKAILNAAAAETAVTGVEMDRKKIEDADLDAFFRDLSGKKIEVEVFASKGRMKIHLIQRATKVKPEEKIRWKK